MSIAIGLKSSSLGVCGCCSRRSSGVGVIEHGGSQDILFLCVACAWNIKIGFRIIEMNTLKLDEVESRAIAAAADECIEDAARIVLRAFYDSGSHNLQDIDKEKFNYVIEELKNSKKFNGVLAKLLVIYSNEIRSLVADEK